MLRFGKVTLENLKIGQLLRALATPNFHEFFENKFYSKSIWFDKKNLFCVGIYHEKIKKGGIFVPPPV